MLHAEARARPFSEVCGSRLPDARYISLDVPRSLHPRTHRLPARLFWSDLQLAITRVIQSEPPFGKSDLPPPSSACLNPQPSQNYSILPIIAINSRNVSPVGSGAFHASPARSASIRKLSADPCNREMSIDPSRASRDPPLEHVGEEHQIGHSPVFLNGHTNSNACATRTASASSCDKFRSWRSARACERRLDIARQFSKKFLAQPLLPQASACLR